MFGKTTTSSSGTSKRVLNDPPRSRVDIVASTFEAKSRFPAALIASPRAGDAYAAGVRQRSQPCVPAGAPGPRRGRRLLGLARADARAGREADPGVRPRRLRGDVRRDAGGRL